MEAWPSLVNNLVQLESASRYCMIVLCCCCKGESGQDREHRGGSGRAGHLGVRSAGVGARGFARPRFSRQAQPVHPRGGESHDT